VKKGSKGFSVTVWAAIAVGAVGVGVVIAFLAGYFLGHYTGHEKTTTVSMAPANSAPPEPVPTTSEETTAKETTAEETTPKETTASEETTAKETTAEETTPKETTASEEAPAEPKAEAALAAGKTVFTTNCASCHTLSEAGTTGTVGPNLDELQPEKALVETQVTNGGGVMPAFGGTLSPEEIEDVAEYVSTVAGTGQ
jgi:mono/diheme cytochrome c family protein